MKLEPTSVEAILDQISLEFSPSLKQKKMEIEVAADQRLKAMVDPHVLHDLLENLVSNAIKFSSPGSEVKLGALPQDNQVRIFVRDQGPGILPQDLPRLFGKFQKLSARPTAGEPSTGLGLAIVKEYVEQMNGSIWCESEPGQGATFWVEFPQAHASTTQLSRVKTHSLAVDRDSS